MSIVPPQMIAAEVNAIHMPFNCKRWGGGSRVLSDENDLSGSRLRNVSLDALVIRERPIYARKPTLFNGYPCAKLRCATLRGDGRSPGLNSLYYTPCLTSAVSLAAALGSCTRVRIADTSAESHLY